MCDPALASGLLSLTEQLIGFPRHLSQHVGGFVITEGPAGRLCRSSNAAMPGRTVIEWDKDDIDALGHPEGRHPRARHADLHPQARFD
jgi:error-prone DNA polymerase